MMLVTLQLWAGVQPIVVSTLFFYAVVVFGRIDPRPLFRHIAC